MRMARKEFTSSRNFMSEIYHHRHWQLHNLENLSMYRGVHLAVLKCHSIDVNMIGLGNG